MTFTNAIPDSSHSRAVRSNFAPFPIGQAK